MKNIIKILMERDGISEREAKRQVKDCRIAVLEAIDDGADWEVDDIVADYLGLEPDYILDIL